MSQSGFVPILIVVLISLAALGGYVVYQNQYNPTIYPQPSPTPSDANPGTDYPPPIQLARKDLAKQLGVKEDQITVSSLEEKQWSDKSLGCPDEGKVYAQIITPGYKVILTYNHPLAEFQKTYEYHTDKGSSREELSANFVQCNK